MGTTQSQNLGNKIFRAEEWQPIEWQPYTNMKDPTFSSNFVVYGHRSNSNMQIEKYSLFFNSQAEYFSYLETYNQRCRFPSLVNAVYIEQTSRQGMCSTFHSASLYLQRINFRLFELIQIPVDEGLYMLDTALDGYEKMFYKTGYFDISSDMIGVNKQGKVKVWINKNFSKSLPDFNRIDHNKGESEFVLHLIKIVQHCIDYPQGQPKFTDFLYSKKSLLSFGSIRNLIKEYHKVYNYIPLKMMKSILLWVKRNNINKSTSSSRILENNKSEVFVSSTQEEVPNFQRNKGGSQAIQVFHGNKIEFTKLKTRKFNKNKANEKTKIILQSQHNLGKDNTQSMSQVGDSGRSDTDRFYGPCQGNGVMSKSFVQNEKKILEIREVPAADVSNIKLSGKNLSKLPSVSFSYKSSGLFSPQNIDGRPNEWFRSKKGETGQRQKRKQIRHSLTLNMPQEECHNMKVYYSNDHTHEIDSEILQDLNLIGQKDQ